MIKRGERPKIGPQSERKGCEPENGLTSLLEDDSLKAGFGVRSDL